MITRTRSTPRPKLESAPSKSEQITLPPVKSFDSPKSPKKPQKLIVNNYVSHSKHRSLDFAVDPEIETLHELCNQLLRGQEELKDRLQRQENIIEELKTQSKAYKSKGNVVEIAQGRKIESLVRRLPAFTPRGMQESGCFTFRPSETEKEKTKFPREIFSRKSRARPC